MGEERNWQLPSMPSAVSAVLHFEFIGRQTLISFSFRSFFSERPIVVIRKTMTFVDLTRGFNLIAICD